MSDKKIPVIIDCDTGVDDAGALMMACAYPGFDILAVTTVSGNVALEHTHRNTMNCLKLFGREDIPVAKGADAPLARVGIKASAAHGFNGLRGFRFEENYTASQVELPAAAYIAQLLEKSKEKVTIIALGPLTNIAILLLARPDIREKIDRIVFMGTSDFDGNPTPVTTFNVMVDPEAFDICLNSGVDFYGCSLNASRKAVVTAEQVREILKMKSRVAETIYQICFVPYSFSEEEIRLLSNSATEEPFSEKRAAKMMGESKTFALLDEAAMAFAIRPELFSFNKYYCRVEKEGSFTLGMTFIDRNNYYQKAEREKNLFYVKDVDTRGFAKLFFELLESYEKQRR